MIRLILLILLVPSLTFAEEWRCLEMKDVHTYLKRDECFGESPDIENKTYFQAIPQIRLKWNDETDEYDEVNYTTYKKKKACWDVIDTNQECNSLYEVSDMGRMRQRGRLDKIITFVKKDGHLYCNT